MDWPKRDDPYARPRSRREIRRELDEELQFHLEQRSEELVAKGFAPEEARREAMRRMGDVDAVREACLRAESRQDKRRHLARVLDDLRLDVRHALRRIVRQPLFAAVVVATLAVGIGASTAIVSVARQLLFSPLPYAGAERIVTLWEWDRERDSRREVAGGNFTSWTERASSFEALGLAEPTGVDLRLGDGAPVSLEAWSVTPDWFRALGVRPILGRAFEPQDYVAIADCAAYRCYADPVVLLSYEFWQQQFGGDPSVVGRDFVWDGAPATVVGILPPGIDYPSRKPVWQPLLFSERGKADRRASYMHAIGRLAPGVTPDHARADLQRIAAQLAGEFPATNRLTGFEVVPLQDEVLGRVRQGIGLLFVASVILLVVACANVANLLLVRGVERTTEAGVRAAIGAGRGRLVRQFGTESLVLSMFGGLAGALVAWGGVWLLRAIAPPETPRIDTLGLDWEALPVALGIAMATSLVFGLLPALRSAKVSTATLLRTSGGSATASGRARLRAAIVCGEIALAIVVLVGASLLARSFQRLTANDLGFVPDELISVQMFLWDNNETAEKRLARMSEYEERFRAIPGVEDVGIVSSLPFHPHAITAAGAFRLEGMLPDEQPTAFTTVASPGYFRAMGIPILRGRSFEERDDAAAPRVALVSESFARAYFPGGGAVGKEITIGVMSAPATRTIVGVVGDVRPTGYDSQPRMEVFVPYRQSGSGHTTFVIRSASVEGLSGTLQQAVFEIDPLQPIYHTATMESLVRGTLAERRFHLLVVGAFAAMALVLSVIGTYGLISFSVRQRAGEIGVRMAVGASAGRIVAMVVRGGIAIGLAGSLAGLLVALFASQFLSGMLYGVAPTDPATLLAVVATMVVVAACSSVIPAIRLSRLDAARVLREE